MVQTIDMPARLADDARSSETSAGRAAKSMSNGGPNITTNQRSHDSLKHAYQQTSPQTVEGGLDPWSQSPLGTLNMNGTIKEGFGGKDGSVLLVPNGSSSDRAPSAKSVALSTRTKRNGGTDTEKKVGETVKETSSRLGVAEEGYLTPANGKPVAPSRPPLARPSSAASAASSDAVRTGLVPSPILSGSSLPPVQETFQGPRTSTDGMLKPPTSTQVHRASSPPAFSNHPSVNPVPTRPDRLVHRHTLEVPRVNTRTSQDGFAPPSASDGPLSATGGRFSPNTPTRRRGSLQLVRRATRSIHSDMHLDEAPQDEEAARWAEHIRAKRASKRLRTDTDDDRVVVGTKVDEHHENFVRAYNMLTGIRFCVSRVNAKLERDLTDADFVAKHKYSFDITGSELTPSAKYDFKFKDYAPWVFRHLRASFGLDPAEYLVSLTSKYILSELGSPGKSGSFFYFSRDYKYIIKTIHHGEHKFLRKILKDYYSHVLDNPNTLLSQFYGLHRVKMPYGKKVHFVVMNNLFPPHRDIHRTFDLKGSTIGRDYKEDDLEKNPRATLKDLNWLRRNLHLEFGPAKKDMFVAQMQRDVALLQKLKIMDYSMLVGIHDLERGNEENLRDKTLQVFQPGADKPEEAQMGILTRTPSKMESAKRARELRATVKKERPVPMAQAVDKMPDEAHRRGAYFYSDDGGFQATHEDNAPGEEIYYLGIIDCLTRYNFVKKAEHFWKGMGGHESQISPIPPERYGDRFIKFISGVTMSREQGEKERVSNVLAAAGVDLPAIIDIVDDPRLGGMNLKLDDRNPAGTAKVIEKAEREAAKSKQHGASEENVPDRSLSSTRSPGENNEATTLPVIGEAAESASNTSRSPSKALHSEDFSPSDIIIGNANMSPESIGEAPPPTPPFQSFKGDERRESWGGRPPPTPPKDDERGRFGGNGLLTPIASSTLSSSPTRMVKEEMERARNNVGHAM
ncbi:SAICAR synthase-like protein [Acrodontium crateriforme]|uniref:1-phosphatidylinositol-4-phosphate 5-kinase n=1 Tax=Acrodontium crateriforme TaxID=150365 RepID=A0AAQ3LY54_9PEZI|nr:SAICAR synthase-like protein [Acrodontium crateriforme]